ncbi:hypothetical protein C1A50_2155 [Paenibacillus polymyxa]|nr:hypothetical protein C1A50_2155 [Paenibacillus polymyxa]
MNDESGPFFADDLKGLFHLTAQKLRLPVVAHLNPLNFIVVLNSILKVTLYTNSNYNALYQL